MSSPQQFTWCATLCLPATTNFIAIFTAPNLSIQVSKITTLSNFFQRIHMSVQDAFVAVFVYFKSVLGGKFWWFITKTNLNSAFFCKESPKFVTYVNTSAIVTVAKCRPLGEEKKMSRQKPGAIQCQRKTERWKMTFQIFLHFTTKWESVSGTVHATISKPSSPSYP